MKNSLLLRAHDRYRELRRSEGVSFVHNDYLGLSTHPRLIEAAKWALDICGAGSRGSRLLGGHSQIFEEVEEKLARFFGGAERAFFLDGISRQSCGHARRLGNWWSTLSPMFAIMRVSSMAFSLAGSRKPFFHTIEWASSIRTQRESGFFRRRIALQHGW